MANTEHIKALIAAFAESDNRRFYSAALQLAANEARAGHTRVANELRDLIEEARSNSTLQFSRRDPTTGPVPIHTPSKEIRDFVSVDYPSDGIQDYAGVESTLSQLRDLSVQLKRQSLLARHGLAAPRKVLFVGPPGSGKSFAARILAAELRVPILTVHTNMMMSIVHEKALSILDEIFAALHVSTDRGIVFIEDWTLPSSDPNVIESSRHVPLVINVAIQRILKDRTERAFIVERNQFDEMTGWISQEFDAVLRFEYLERDEAIRFMMKLLRNVDVQNVDWNMVSEHIEQRNQKELSKSAAAAARTSVLQQEPVSTELLIALLSDDN